MASYYKRMEHSLPTTLQGLINGLLEKRPVSSWRIFGEKQIVVCIRFEEESRHLSNYSTPSSPDHPQQIMAYRKNHHLVLKGISKGT